jgi:hypothetical protein
VLPEPSYTRRSRSASSRRLTPRSGICRRGRIASTRLRSGTGWQESATIDVLNEVLYAYPQHVKKALALALLSGKR